MKNIVLLTHGEFSKGIAQSCRFILGDVQNLKALSITLEESAAQTRQMLNDVIASFENDAPTVLLTDLPGGSTTQAAIALLAERPELYLISGLNLGLLVSVAMMDFTEDREENLRQLRLAVEEAKETLTLINELQADPIVISDDGEL